MIKKFLSHLYSKNKTQVTTGKYIFNVALISKFMTSQSEKKTNAIYILSNDVWSVDRM